jgi:hypothetical protein
MMNDQGVVERVNIRCRRESRLPIRRCRQATPRGMWGPGDNNLIHDDCNNGQSQMGM